MGATTRAATAEDVTRDPLRADVSVDARRAWVADAADCFRLHGVIAIRDAIPKAAIGAVLDAAAEMRETAR